MYLLIHRVIQRMNAHTLERTSFCDSCMEVCTPDCRHDALIRHQRDRAQFDGFIRL
jgi:hypothetical protein